MARGTATLVVLLLGAVGPVHVGGARRCQSWPNRGIWFCSGNSSNAIRVSDVENATRCQETCLQHDWCRFMDFDSDDNDCDLRGGSGSCKDRHSNDHNASMCYDDSYSINRNTGLTCQEAGYHKVMTQRECEAIAAVLGLSFRGTTSYGPTGCLEYDGFSASHHGVYFNDRNGNGREDSDHHMICEKDSVSPTSAPSTSAPSTSAPSTSAPSTAVPSTSAPSTAVPSATPSTSPMSTGPSVAPTSHPSAKPTSDVLVLTSTQPLQRSQTQNVTFPPFRQLGSTSPASISPPLFQRSPGVADTSVADTSVADTSLQDTTSALSTVSLAGRSTRVLTDDYTSLVPTVDRTNMIDSEVTEAPSMQPTNIVPQAASAENSSASLIVILAGLLLVLLAGLVLAAVWWRRRDRGNAANRSHKPLSFETRIPSIVVNTSNPVFKHSNSISDHSARHTAPEPALPPYAANYLVPVSQDNYAEPSSQGEYSTDTAGYYEPFGFDIDDNDDDDDGQFLYDIGAEISTNTAASYASPITENELFNGFDDGPMYQSAASTDNAVWLPGPTTTKSDLSSQVYHEDVSLRSGDQMGYLLPHSGEIVYSSASA